MAWKEIQRSSGAKRPRESPYLECFRTSVFWPVAVSTMTIARAASNSKTTSLPSFDQPSRHTAVLAHLFVFAAIGGCHVKRHIVLVEDHAGPVRRNFRIRPGADGPCQQFLTAALQVLQPQGPLHASTPGKDQFAPIARNGRRTVIVGAFGQALHFAEYPAGIRVNREAPYVCGLRE